MYVFIHKKMFILVALIGALCALTAPASILADGEKDKSSGVAKPAPAKLDAPAAGLTERERMLLDRVEQLEKRVAELEAKGSPSAPTAARADEVAATQPSPTGITNAVSATTIAPSETGATVTPSASTNVIPTDKAVAALSPQAADKGKPGAPKAPASDPFAFADFTWLNGNARTKESPMDTKFFTPEIRADVDYVYDFAHPKDDTIGGSSEIFRANEVQVTQLGVGGDFHYDNVRARLMTQFGLYSETTARNDASPGARPVEPR